MLGKFKCDRQFVQKKTNFIFGVKIGHFFKHQNIASFLFTGNHDLSEYLYGNISI